MLKLENVKPGDKFQLMGMNEKEEFVFLHNLKIVTMKPEEFLTKICFEKTIAVFMMQNHCAPSVFTVLMVQQNMHILVKDVAFVTPIDN